MPQTYLATLRQILSLLDSIDSALGPLARSLDTRNTPSHYQALTATAQLLTHATVLTLRLIDATLQGHTPPCLPKPTVSTSCSTRILSIASRN